MLVKFERIPMVRPAWKNVSGFEREIDSFFNGFFSPGSGSKWAPAIDLVEKQNESIAVAELPGIAKEEIKISLEEEMLTISGERKAVSLPDRARWIRTERPDGEFFRTIQLPHPVKAGEVTAELGQSPFPKRKKPVHERLQ
jgi:HSP20 family protein